MPAKTHGDSYACEYRSWKMMRSRCTNPNDPAYHNYGERGIRVCDRWDDYGAFLLDMGRRPTPAHTLERIDNSKGYSPENCRWATRAEQLRNRRNNRNVTHNGTTMCVADWSTKTGIPKSTLRYRLRRWPIAKALAS